LAALSVVEVGSASAEVHNSNGTNDIKAPKHSTSHERQKKVEWPLTESANTQSSA